MPIYELRCTECGHNFENFRRYSEHGQWDDCPECGGTPFQVISRPMSVHVDNMPEYLCPATNQVITSRKKRRESFARHGLMDANDLGPPDPAPPIPRAKMVSDGVTEAPSLDEAPPNMPKMSRQEQRKLEEDIKSAVEKIEQGQVKP